MANTLIKAMNQMPVFHVLHVRCMYVTKRGKQSKMRINKPGGISGEVQHLSSLIRVYISNYLIKLNNK